MRVLVSGSLLILVASLACSKTLRNYGELEEPGGNGGGGGQGGSTSQGECSRATDCPLPKEECLEPVCDANTCSIAPQEAGTPCSAGVCSGAGTCAECVPGRTRCEGDTPFLCTEAGTWAEQPSCGLGSKCHDGRCRGLEVEWYFQADSHTRAEIRGLGVDDAGRVYFAGTYFRNLELGDHALDQEEPYGTEAFVAQLSPDGTPTYLNRLEADTPEELFSLAVAGNGNHYIGFSGTSSASQLLSFNSHGQQRFTQRFSVPTPDDGLPVSSRLTFAPTTNGNNAYALVQFTHEVRWLKPSSPGYGEFTKDGAHLLVAELSGGTPSWTTSYPWWNTTRRMLALGTNGTMYIVGRAEGDSSVFDGLPTLGETTFESVGSLALVKASTSDGAILEAREFPSTSNGGTIAHASATLPSGQLIVMVSSTAEIRLTSDVILSPSVVYLVKFDPDLNPIAHVALGEGDTSFYPPQGAGLAVNESGEIFVAGGIRSDFDFGAGTHEYQGDSWYYGDGFVAAYDSDLNLLFSQTYGSPASDYVGGLAVDASHLYLGLYIGDTIDLHGTPLSPRLNGTSSVIVKYALR